MGPIEFLFKTHFRALGFYGAYLITLGAGTGGHGRLGNCP